MAQFPALVPAQTTPNYGVTFAQNAANTVNSIPQPPPTAPSAAAPIQQAPDPYAPFGGAGGYSTLTQGFADQKNNIYTGANDAATNAGVGINGSILDLVSGLKSGQQAIDNKAINNELAKRQGVAATYDMVGRGIRSGGVLLANKNASDSSAAEAVARAYGDMGRRQLSSVGQQYELGNRDVTQSQAAFDEQRAAGVRHIQDSKTQVVNQIVTDARNQLAALNAAMAYATVPDRIAIEQEKETIKNQVLGKLQQYDQQLTTAAGSVVPSSAENRRTQAGQLQVAGQAPADAFSYTTQAPAEFQNSGPFASQLPIFTLPKKQTA